jgi:hypothetical protein
LPWRWCRPRPRRRRRSRSSASGQRHGQPAGGDRRRRRRRHDRVRSGHDHLRVGPAGIDRSRDSAAGDHRFDRHPRARRGRPERIAAARCQHPRQVGRGAHAKGPSRQTRCLPGSRPEHGPRLRPRGVFALGHELLRERQALTEGSAFVNQGPPLWMRRSRRRGEGSDKGSQANVSPHA